GVGCTAPNWLPRIQTNFGWFARANPVRVCSIRPNTGLRTAGSDGTLLRTTTEMVTWAASRLARPIPPGSLPYGAHSKKQLTAGAAGMACRCQNTPERTIQAWVLSCSWMVCTAGWLQHMESSTRPTAASSGSLGNSELNYPGRE